MKILGIETAAMMSSVALIEDRTLIVEHNVRVSLNCSERLVFIIKRVLEDGGVGLESLDGIAVSIGPGSFTGVRIGVGTAKALSYCAKKPLLPVPTLEGMVSLCQNENAVLCPLLDARRGEVYFSLFRRGRGILKETYPPSCGKPERVVEIVSSCLRNGEKVSLVGPGVSLLTGAAKGEMPFEAVFSGGFAPRALGVALRGDEILLSGRWADPLTLVPLYVRPSDAELKLGKRFDA